MLMNESIREVGADAPCIGPGASRGVAPCVGSGGGLSDAPCIGPGASRAVARGAAGGGEAFHHSMKRRCFVHDYKGRSIYLITLEVAGRQRLLGRILGADAPGTGPGSATPEIPLSASGLSEAELSAINARLFEPSELGRRVAEEFMKICEHVPGVKPLLAQAMPDHFHGILFVTREINRTLGSIVAGFKGKCSQVARELGATEALTRQAPDCAGGGGVKVSLWEEGFHDRILTSDGQLEKMFRYVRDNPRRLALRLKYPDLFTSVRCLAGHGHIFDAYGNGFLLQSDAIVQVQCSRRFFGFKREEKLGQTPNTPNRKVKVTREVAFETPEFVAKKAELFAAAKKGAVLCSPCISDGEKAIAYAAVDAGYSLIVLRNEPFPLRFKPSGRFFDACAEGRLLMLCPQRLMSHVPNGGDRQPAHITRAECLALNAVVAEICGGNADDIVYQGFYR